MGSPRSYETGQKEFEVVMVGAQELLLPKTFATSREERWDGKSCVENDDEASWRSIPLY